MSNTTQNRLSAFMKYAPKFAGVVWPQRVLGAWDFEMDFELESYDQFQDIIVEMKEKFPDVVRNHDFCIVSKEFKLDLFPGCRPQLERAQDRTSAD